MNFFIANLREIKSMTLFKSYINLISCPTDFALITGVLSFVNDNNMLTSDYFIDETNENEYSKIMTVTDNGLLRYTHKIDKYYPGIRMSFHNACIDEKLIISKMDINEDLSVVEYGYFPKSLIRPKRKEKTGYMLKLPRSKSAFLKPTYEDFEIYKDDDAYFIEYLYDGLFTNIDNNTIYGGNKASFKLEPIRFWLDNNSGLLISQDVILGGVPYRVLDKDEEYRYDDFMDSDLYKVLCVIEDDIKITNELLDRDGKKRVKK